MGILQNSNAMGGVSGNYQITNSLRFNSASIQYLNKTFTNSNNSFTFSAWVKLGSISTNQVLFGVDASNYFTYDGGPLRIRTSGTNRVTTTAQFRDPAAWYHIVFVRNGGQGGTTSAFSIYVNNQLVGTYTGDGGTLLSGVVHYIGQDGASGRPFDGYMTEINLIDGQALDPSSFGTTDTISGQWVAKAYTGSYGTNGAELQFTNGTSTTTLGNDTSGNSNNWTLTNFTRIAGVNDCWMKDVPSGNGTSGTQPSSNYSVLNPLDKLTTATLTNANLSFTGIVNAIGSIGITSGKWYWEVIWNGTGGSNVGVRTVSTSSIAAVGGTTVGVRFDRNAGTLEYTIDGSSWTSIATGLTSGEYFPFISSTSTATRTANANFGQRSFAYTIPTGYVALCSNNLATSTIVKGNTVFDATLYTGTNASLAVTNAAGFSPDLVWIKNRNITAYNHALFDTIRGATKYLSSNTTSAETTDSLSLTSFNSDGFTVNSAQETGKGSINYVAWQWDAGSSTVTNSDGSISSQVRANPTAGFSIVAYTGTSSNATVGHGLGVAPSMIIVKNRTTNTLAWGVYHSKLTSAANWLNLNTTGAESAKTGAWNSTPPTSSVFSIGTSTDTNKSTDSLVAYCFSEIAGFSKFGSYTGNGNVDGTFVYLGFKPKFVLFKQTNVASNWTIADSARDPFNVVDLQLNPNTSTAEGSNTSTGAPYMDFLSNGFKIRSTSANQNTNGGTYIYMAFAENPFQNSNAR